MTLSEYQAAADLFMKPYRTRRSTMSYAIGLGEETGEVLGVINKNFFSGKALSIREELGDVLWYLSALATSHGLSLDDIALKNIHKLGMRFPDGWTADGGVR